MQVKWHLLEEIAATKAIDLWVLFPLGVAVNRLLTRKSPPPKVWEQKLTDFFGTEDWKDRFYQRQSDMFGNEISSKTANLQQIGQFFIERLQTIFADVAPKPRMLASARNTPLYLLCFAAGNQRGAKTAIKIADHILTKTEPI